MNDLKLFGVAGKPVMHSFSQALWTIAFANLKQNAKYLKIMAQNASEVIEIFTQNNFAAINITAPFKQEIIPFIHELEAKAAFLNSANLILNRNGKIHGFNTDIEGVKNSLIAYYQPFMKVAVIGTGGAAPAALAALQELNLQFTVFGRNAAKRLELANKFECDSCDAKLINKYSDDYDIIISTIPAHTEILETKSIMKKHIIFDANYSNSVLYEHTIAAGASFISGKNWLINQAIPAIDIFFNTTIDYKTLESGLENFVSGTAEVISLIGAMGVGKSTVGAELATKMKYQFIDLDQVIERVENKTIASIFQTEGEFYFRKKESEILKMVIQQKKIILACGGGVVSSHENIEILKNSSLCIWLNAGIDYCLDGLNLQNRPLLNVSNPRQKAQEIYESRKNYYAETAQVFINVEGKNCNQIANEIYEEINTTFGICGQH